MAIEIERKYRISNDSWRDEVHESHRIRQGYLATTDRSSTRVRVSGQQATINIKQAIPGTTRLEYEYVIPISDAKELLDKLCERPLLEKTRHIIIHGDITWEIDEFHGDNQGLIIAEVELTSEKQGFTQPQWLGDEVTNEVRFYNVSLLSEPYCQWPDEGR